MSNTDKEMINKFKDYAECADAAYAKLDFVDGFIDIGKWYEKEIEYGDKQKLGDKFKKSNSTYARCIEARFMQDIVIEKGTFKDTTINNDPKNISATATLSLRTKNFVNRFKLLHHVSLESFFSQSGFSATLFYDTKATSKDLKYIFAIRGSNDENDIITDFKDIFASKSNPKAQYFDMLLFYKDCIKQGYIQETTPLVIVGHSLGGALAQLFALSFATAENANIINEVYTFNAPGAKTLQVHYNINPIPHYIIHFTKKDLVHNENINHKLNHALSEYYDVYLRYEGQSSTQNFERELEQQLWDMAYTLKKEQGNDFYLGIYFDPFNAMLPHVYLLKQEEDYRYYPILSYYHCLYKNYKERKPLASFKSTYHIETKDNAKEFIPVLGYPNNATQHLWTDIDGYYYAINVGGIMGIPSHYLKYSIRTLYFYSYLLELDSNNTMLKSSIKSNDDKEGLSGYIHKLNVFMDNVRIAMNILVYEIDKKNKEKYNKFKKKTKWYKKTPKYEDIDFLALCISQINELSFKIESIKQDSNQYLTSSIEINEVIDIILKLQEYNYFIEIIDSNKLREMRNQCKADNKTSIAEKLSLETCQPFRLVNKNNIDYINENNFNKLFGYKDLGYILSQEWHEEYSNGRYKMMKGLYFEGNTISSFSKYARNKWYKELQVG